MKYQIITTNRSISKATEARIFKKLSVIEKYLLIKDTTECRVVIKDVPDGRKVEVTIPTKVAILRGEAVDRQLYAAIDKVIDKIRDQLRRAKTKMDRRHRENLGRSFDLDEIEEIEEEDIPVKTKSLYLDVMDLDTAIANMELLGHSFYIYRDDEENKVAVVYKRNNGGYGLIEVD
ncbi:ribosome-associated translation inhibitor RaiA [bacterium]|jgi:putative sigma-54 modulation protein|nr:ribosome-associated translation inhibitor RaiA [bacterium]